MTLIRVDLSPYENNVINTYCDAKQVSDNDPVTKTQAIKEIICLFGKDSHEDMLKIIQERSTKRC